MDMYARNYYEDIKIKKSAIYRNFNSKKKFKMYFEKLPTKERKKYMEEQNLREININTITWGEVQKSDIETKKFLLNTWIEQYGDNDSSIDRNTAVTRFQLSALRKECGFKAGAGKQYNRIGRKVTKNPKKSKEDTVIVELPVSDLKVEGEVEYAELPIPKPTKEPEPIQEVKPVDYKSFKEVLSLNLDDNGETARNKLESIMIFLDLNKNYNIEIKIFETR